MRKLKQPDPNKGLKAYIKEIYELHKRRYGYRRITTDLGLKGIKVNHKKVLRLMREMNIKAVRPKKKYNAYMDTAGCSATKHILQRNFQADQPSQKLVTDVTEFKLGSQKFYLSPVMDLFNREVISYTLFKQPTFEMVSTMLTQAMPKLNLDQKVILHSDQGWHYRIPAFKKMLEKSGITQSMSRKGNCWDNAVIESFFATFKNEYHYRFKEKSEENLRAAVDEYIRYYNEDRIKLDLKMSPVMYRKKYENNCKMLVQQ